MFEGTQFNPLERTLSDDIAVNSARLIATRWAAGIMVILATAFCVRLLKLPLPEGPLYLTGLAILLYNGALIWHTQRIDTPPEAPAYRRRVCRLAILQVALDWVSIGVFIHLTGGISSPALVFFFLHVLMVAILLVNQSPYLYATLAVGEALFIAILEGGGVIPHYTVIPGLPADIHTNRVYIVSQIIFFAIALFATVFLSASIMERLRERERQIAALFRATRDVSSTLNLENVLQHLAQNAAQALNAPAASIRTLDESGSNLTVAASYGLSREYLEKGHIQLAHSQLDRKVLAGEPVIVQEAATYQYFQYPEKVAEEGIRSMVVAPILGPKRPLGLLRVYAYEANRFTAKDADFVYAIARQGAAAIENALAHDALQKANEERAQFVRIVTHELRSPAAGSKSLTGLLLRGLVGEITEKQRDIIERLDRRMDSLLALVNDLLDFAAAKSVGRHDPLEAVNLHDVLKHVVDKASAQAKEKHIEFSYHANGDFLSINATEDGLARVFDNLVGNAVKYTPGGGAVDVTLKSNAAVQPTYAVVTVADTGIGIPADMLDRLGEEFFRAPNAKNSDITGTGLGLSIVKQLIDQFGGQMTVESSEGKGSTFTITLPLTNQDDETNAA